MLLGSRFVGRADELASLRASLEAARAGGGRVVLVSGDPGIGKTRLVEEALAAVPRERALWGRCREGAGAPAYWPWIQALRAYVERCPRDRLAQELGTDIGELARIVPLELAAAPPAIGDPEPARFRLFDAVTRFLCRIGRDELVVVVLDDLHWSDAESLLLLRFLGAEIRDARLLVVGTYREREAHQVVIVPRLLADLARVAQRLPPVARAPTSRRSLPRGRRRVAGGDRRRRRRDGGESVLPARGGDAPPPVGRSARGCPRDPARGARRD
jgi:hypothetical protein